MTNVVSLLYFFLINTDALQYDNVIRNYHLDESKIHFFIQDWKMDPEEGSGEYKGHTLTSLLQGATSNNEKLQDSTGHV